MHYFTKKISILSSKILLLVVFVSLFAGAIIPQHVNAAVPTFDVGLNPLLAITQPTIVDELAILNTMQASQHLKEVGPPPWPPAASAFLEADNLDVFGWTIAKLLMAALMEQIVNWVRDSGVDKGPLFITDWAFYLQNAADQAGGEFIEELKITQICQPFKRQITTLFADAGSISNRVPISQRGACTVSDSLNSMGAFYNDFSGSWEMYNTLLTQPQNNYYGEYLIALDNMMAEQDITVTGAEKEAESALGFLGEKECESYDIDIPGTDDDPGGTVTFEDCSIISPGKSVETELSKVLETNLENFNIADELDEVLAAILGSILQNVIFEAGGILSSTLDPVPTPPPQYPSQPPRPVCGDNVCSVSENPLNCSRDCSTTPTGTPTPTPTPTAAPIGPPTLPPLPPAPP